MTHDEMIEVVAKAMSEVEAHDGGGTLAEHIHQSEFPDLARAAIRMIAPAVLEEAAYEWSDDDQEWTGPEVATAIRAIKTRYE